MIRKIKLFFESYMVTEEPSEEERQRSLNMAVAAIFIEMVGIDNKIDVSEESKLKSLLKQQLKISEIELNQLVSLAQQELKESVDYYQFTSLINQNFDMPEKIQVIENLWKIAYADGKVDSYEEHYLRKICDLLFVPHSEFIKAKLRVVKE
ncbi:TerB family tellurite resistance protein [Aliikangiella coralliicola]|uniref:TerB family tellurite resistance protein n=1 Tax=Aliikangiella coralliicola TaxID=2592383 RepID=A0A545UJQ7_9GAMM|nr:TerB family tellurite resistance protein [Aliikangiella coralliicola]TQV89697.1 TerB family tellurite resistance protein [Aliikangiella coralliicola]